jgi:hypothetical protein
MFRECKFWDQSLCCFVGSVAGEHTGGAAKA